MSQSDDAAFPIVINLAMDPRLEQGGLTKREIFAMAAMQGMLAGRDRDGSHSAVARESVLHADALMDELAKERK